MRRWTLGISNETGSAGDEPRSCTGVTFAIVLAACGLILCLGNSCALWRGNAPPSTPAPARAQAANGAGPASGASSSRLVGRATVDDASDAEAPSPGRDLLEHAIGGGDELPPSGIGGGNGVPVAGAERRVGVVRVIGAHGKFVLIDTTTGYGDVPLTEGQNLHSRGSAAGGGVQTAELKVSRERQAPFLVADVVSGEPQTGDVAYFTVEKKK